MNAVAYFSCSGQCKALAENIADKLGWDTLDMRLETNLRADFERLFCVFPVHCQGLPQTVKKFLKRAKATHYCFIALYGKASAGNAIYEAHKLTGKHTLAAAYMPANHTYCGVDGSIPSAPQSVINSIFKSDYIKIPRRQKAPFAGVFTNFRSRLLIKIKRGDNCVNCNICGGLCPQSAIENGEITGDCSRCLSCVYGCPHGALTVKKSFILKQYLKKPKSEKVIIYV